MTKSLNEMAQNFIIASHFFYFSLLYELYTSILIVHSSIQFVYVLTKSQIPKFIIHISLSEFVCRILASTIAESSSFEVEPKRALEEARVELIQLFGRIKEIKEKAETSEQMVARVLMLQIF